MRFRTFALFLIVCACSAALIAEEEAERPDKEAAVAPEAAAGEGEAADKPALSPELQNRAAFFRRAAAYFRDTGDEERARLSEKRAAAIESGEIGDFPESRRRRSEQGRRPARGEGAAERERVRRTERDEENPRAGTPGSRRLDSLSARRETGSPMMNVAGERVAELQKELKKARAANDEARVKELSERIALLRAMILQEAVVLEQARRVADLERDIKTIKDLLRRLAAGGEEKGE